MSMRHAIGWCGLGCALVFACNGGNGSDDDADIAGDVESEAEDGADGTTPQMVGSLRFEPAFVGLLAGETRSVRVWVEHPPSEPIVLSFVAAPAAPVAVPAEVTLAGGAWSAELEVTGLAVGTAVVTVTYGARAADLTADVQSPELACTGAAVTGRLAAGGTVAATSGDLAGASVSMPPDATLTPVDVALACAEDIVPEGFTPIGPAVRIGPDARFPRELRVALPVRIALLPGALRMGDVVVFWTDERLSVRIVSFASPWLTGMPGGGHYAFDTVRFGTFQAAYRTGAGTGTRDRRYTYRGITGVSMGGGGAALVGLRNPERFDFIAPLGGPANWTHLLDYIRTYNLGGFCTASPDDAGDVGEHCAVPPPRELFEQSQEFEKWIYPDGRDGQGGTFDREEYCQIFRDMALAFGNPSLFNEASVYLPPGIPASWWALPGDERCASPVVLEDFYDDEYNPDGATSVITFCDGAEIPGDHGRWNPDGVNDFPLDVGLAVDVDGDTVRDAGEPVIRAGHEPYDDVGVDGLASRDEPGYDPVDAPDPSGDDFDYQFNPSGMEGNRRWDGPSGTDPGEPWVDAGLDGVLGTPQQSEGGYDWGEGNGEYDDSPNYLNFLEHDADTLLRRMPESELDRISLMGDGGIRDLFPFVTGGNLVMGALAARGRPVSYFNDFSALWGEPYRDEQIDPKKMDLIGLGDHTMIRYGNPDASEALLIRGDGGHVGTVTQVINRLAYVTFAMSARWPGGDRRRTATDTADTMLSFEFTSPSTGRVSPVSMILPPGYHTEAYADVRYPVVYFLHGYGQEPADLVFSAIIFQNWMISTSIPEPLRIQKLIMVFPDGRCRSAAGTPDPEKECIQGTFYADSIRPEGPQMETILLELMDHIDAEYRTRPAETVTEPW